MRRSSRHWLLPWMVLFFSCGETQLPPFGDLITPVALTVHQPTGRVFVASQGGDELRVFDIPSSEFLQSPAISFPLSIPTVASPRFLAAGERFVFVVSGGDGSVGFVDTVVPPGAAGPRSVDDAQGAPITVDPSLRPLAAVAMVSAHGFAEEGALGDQLLLAGLGDDGESGRLVAVRPPVGDEPPSIVATLELPEVFPVGMALEPAFVSEGGALADCRALAIADNRTQGDHVPGIWLSSVQVGVDGSLSVDPFDPSRKIVVEVEVTFPDGSKELRVAPVRAVEFAPVPTNVRLEEAVAIDPCALRSGRIFAVLDRSYCTGTVGCPNFVALDLPSGEIARDAVLGGPAVYELPATPLGLISLEGPITVSGARTQVIVDEEGNPPALQSVEAGPIFGLTLVTSSDGGITYVAGGLGTRLLGPTVDRRTAADPVFLVGASSAVPGLEGAILRVDRRGVSLPRLSFPVEARPRSETWTAGFETPLPGFESLGVQQRLEGDTLRIPAGAQTFLAPVPIRPSLLPEEADRLVPLVAGATGCDGFPIVSISADGLSLTVDREAPGFSNPEACLTGLLPLAILPPRSLPWILSGSVSGFVGRLPADPDLTSSVFFGDRLLLRFQPPEAPMERGASFTWKTTTGFSFFRQQRRELLLPASIASYQVIPPNRFRVVVAYSGSDAILLYNPASLPSPDSRVVFR